MDLFVYEEGAVKFVTGKFTANELVTDIVAGGKLYGLCVSVSEWKEYEVLRRKFLKNSQDKELGALANLYLYRKNKGKSSLFLTKLSLNSRLGGLCALNLGDCYMVTFIRTDTATEHSIERALKETGEVKAVIFHKESIQ